MDQRPTLSLLIPAFNAAEFLPRLLTSANTQSIPFDQIWVYDDCSTDDTAAVAEAYGARVLRGAKNVGCSAGKQNLAEHVDTDWIHFHDADDELMPNFTTLAHRWMKTGDRDVVLFAYEYRDHETGTLIRNKAFDDVALREDARRYAILSQINPFCGLYRRDPMLSAGGYNLDPSTLYNEDVAFHINLAFSGLTFAAEAEISIINWRVGGSMSGSNQVNCSKAHLFVLKETLKRPNAQSYKKEISEKLWLVAGHLAAFKEWRNADEAVRLAASLAAPPRSAGAAWYRVFARLCPQVALRFREIAIRYLKPKLREGYP